MRGVRKLALLLTVLGLLAFGLTACGGGDSGDSTASSTAETATDSAAGTGGQSQEKGDADGGEGSDDEATSGDESGGDSAAAPKNSVKGEGSESFRVEGGDNSIQGFGEEAEESKLEEAETALRGYLDARAAQDWAKQCTYLAKETIEPLEQLASQSPQLKGAACPKLLKEISGSAPASAVANPMTGGLASLRTEGDRSFALFRSDGVRYFMLMKQEDGDWKVAALAPTEFPS